MQAGKLKVPDNNPDPSNDTEPNFPNILGAVLAGGFASAFLAMPLGNLLIAMFGDLWTSVVHGAQLRSTDSGYQIRLWLSASTISLVYILPICIIIAFPMLIFFRNISRIYIMVISCVMATLSVGFVIYFLSGDFYPYAFFSGIPYGIIFGLVVAAFRGPGKIGRFSVEPTN